MQRLHELITQASVSARRRSLNIRILYWSWQGARLERREQRQKRLRDAQMTWMSNGTSTSKTGRTLG